ncbi:Transmembrane protein 145 [Hondaea fermentalgiana]|uniref:Transmembrane protein 145 n=1 Tax=Hondaea fermentalgiana TaxID=2315210 RepID=A0A2R5G6R7_9STRA|nr:Transmembrane protein 145 [Hondaea fermentalgiana]|eukprot:GBG25488.1 Transmembrane protein 145 [Hondaea fermentalgiana]
MTKASWSHKATVLLALVIASGLRHARAGIVEGSYRGSETWMYLDRFVFNPAKSGGELMGRLHMTLDYPSDTATTPSIMLFYKGGDEDGVQKEFGYWERAYNKGLKCHEKAAIASMNGGTYIPLPGGRNVTTYKDNDGREWSSVTLETYMNTHRSRWIFITVGNCKMTCTTRFCANSLDIKYRLVLTNGDGNDKYFSADKAWFWETSVIFFALYVALAILAWRTRLALLSEHKYHHSVRLLVASIAASFLSLLFQVVLYSQFASTGIDNPRLEGLAVFCGLVAEFLLLLMTILVAKGWTIVRHKISALGRVRIAAYMTLYVVSSAGCWIYYAYFVDPADIIYVYSTVPGAVFVSLRGAAFAWFTYAIGVTLRKYQQKRAFYKKFWVLVGCWILTLPALVLINSLVDIWFRAKVVNLLSILSTFLCQAVLCSMYHPTLCGLNRNFPFHATTFAVLKNKTSKPGESDDAKIHGSNTFDEAHLLRAFELSSQMRHSVSMLQTYTSDLHTFLDDIRLTNKDSSSNGKHDIESGIAVHPQMPTQRKDNLSKPIGNDLKKSASTEGDLERALAAVVAPKSAQKANLEQNPAKIIVVS